MATTMQRESTNYVYFGVTGTPPDTAEVAFLAAGSRPTDDDWDSALLVLSASDPLWADAKASKVTGDYYVARLVGAFGSNDVVLDPDDYQSWGRLTGTTEQVVVIFPTVLTVA